MLYALTDNAMFTYDFITEETEKLSSVQGLSGETTSAIHYSTETNRLIIGYENGLVEVIDSDGSITISSDIVSFNQTEQKVLMLFLKTKVNFIYLRRLQSLNTIFYN